MSWSIQQAARASGVTARTLRYYDEIGLLRPARIGANGYRYYEREELLRLQQILLFRELGLDLTTIGTVVDAQRDPIDALRQHHRRLLDQRGRLDRLVATVAETINHLQEGTDMPAEHMFDGFEMSADHLDAVEARRVETTGETEQPEIAEIKRTTAAWSEGDWARFNADGHELTKRMAALLRDGVPADAAETFALLDEDFALQRRLWNPNKTSYVEQAEGLQEPSELRSYYNSHDPRLADYLREAMLAYADHRMH